MACIADGMSKNLRRELSQRCVLDGEAVPIFYSPEDAMRWCACGAFQRER